MAAAPNVEGFAFVAALLDGESPEALPQLTMSVLSHGLLGAAEFPQTATTGWLSLCLDKTGSLCIGLTHTAMARIDRSGATTQMTTGIHLSLTGSETVCMIGHLS
jgi:hypothetical protein